jgi:hypothetical protein
VTPGKERQMSKLNKSWMAVVAAALLLGTLVGVVWARPHDRPQAQDITRKVTITAGEFIPTTDDWNYSNHGNYVTFVSGSGNFSAPVVFPCLPSVTVERIKLHVDDMNNGALARATLFRTYPTTGAQVELGKAASPGGTSAGLKTYGSGAINKTIWPSQRAYIWLYFSGPAINVYGVTVEYHRNI